jgi:hypothetical protein
VAGPQQSEGGGDRNERFDPGPADDGGHGASPISWARSRSGAHRVAVLDVLARPVLTTVLYPLIVKTKRQR